MSNCGNLILNITMVIVTVWIVRKYLNVFFDKREKNIAAAIMWILFFIAQIVFECNKGTPSLWTTLICSILVLLIAICGYQKSGSRKIFCVFLLYVVWTLIEMLVYFYMINMSLNQLESNNIGTVISKILAIIIINLLNIFWGKKIKENISLTYYFVLLFVPTGSIFIAYKEFYSKLNDSNNISSMITLSILLLINIIIFEIYIRLSEQFVIEKEKTVYAQQIEIMTRSTEEQKKTMEEFHKEKHNLVNQLIVLKEGVENSNKDSVIDNLNKIIKAYSINENISNCGNSIIDAMINFKYAIAKDLGIKIYLKIFIPEVLPVNQCDIGIIIGNALDNAIESTRKCVCHEKIINISMGIKKESFVFSIKNPYEHSLKKDKSGNFLSTKKEFSRHGYGVSSLKRVVEKYQGEVLIEEENGYFILTVIISLD